MSLLCVDDGSSDAEAPPSPQVAFTEAPSTPAHRTRAAAFTPASPLLSPAPAALLPAAALSPAPAAPLPATLALLGEIRGTLPAAVAPALSPTAAAPAPLPAGPAPAVPSPAPVAPLPAALAPLGEIRGVYPEEAPKGRRARVTLKRPAMSSGTAKASAVILPALAEAGAARAKASRSHDVDGRGDTVSGSHSVDNVSGSRGVDNVSGSGHNDLQVVRFAVCFASRAPPKDKLKLEVFQGIRDSHLWVKSACVKRGLEPPNQPDYYTWMQKKIAALQRANPDASVAWCVQCACAEFEQDIAEGRFIKPKRMRMASASALTSIAEEVEEEEKVTDAEEEDGEEEEEEADQSMEKKPAAAPRIKAAEEIKGVTPLMKKPAARWMVDAAEKEEEEEEEEEGEAKVAVEPEENEEEEGEGEEEEKEEAGEKNEEEECEDEEEEEEEAEDEELGWDEWGEMMKSNPIHLGELD